MNSVKISPWGHVVISVNGLDASCELLFFQTNRFWCCLMCTFNSLVWQLELTCPAAVWSLHYIHIVSSDQSIHENASLVGGCIKNKTCLRTWTPKLPQNSKSQTFVLDENTFKYQSKFEREVFVTCNEHVEGFVQPWQRLSFSDCSLIVWVMWKLKCMPKGAQRKFMLLDIVYSLNAQ